MLMIPTPRPCQVRATDGAALPDVMPPGFSLWARCEALDCGAAARIDAAPWLAQGLAGTPLRRLETRLRCACGARRARLEIDRADGRTYRHATIYPFR